MWIGGNDDSQVRELFSEAELTSTDEEGWSSDEFEYFQRFRVNDQSYTRICRRDCIQLPCGWAA